MTPVEERRFIARLFAEHAEEWAAGWAAESRDSRGGRTEPITKPPAVEALRRVYAAVLRRGGQDHVERITMEEAQAFPSFAAVAPEGASDAWLAAGLKNRDLPCFGLFITSAAALGDLNGKSIETRGRMEALAILSRITNPE